MGGQQERFLSVPEIAELYRDFLGRDLVDAERATFAESGLALNRASVIAMLTASPEFAIRPAGAREEVAARHRTPVTDVRDVTWFHSYRFPNGTRADGIKAFDQLQAEAQALFRHGVAGKRVLDIGAWDGFFSFEAEKRGAASVLSTDWFCWGGPGWGTKAGYDFAHSAFGSRCESREIDLFDLDPGNLGTFDMVLFPGVLYHLKDPLGGLGKAAAMAGEQLVVETATSHNWLKTPVMRYLPIRSLNGDPTNFFSPNVACLLAMLRDLGFARFDVIHTLENTPVKERMTRSLNGHTRHIVHAWR